MDGFEFVFSLFGLLLGFSLVEVFAGLGRMVETRVRPPQREGDQPGRFGILTLLLALFVVLNLISFWTGAWSIRTAIPVNYLALLLGLIVTGGYYLAATLVFPREASDWLDLDAHYFKVKRWVVAVIVSCNALGALGIWMLGINPFAGAVFLNVMWFAMFAAIFFVRGRRSNLVLLGLLVVQYPLINLIAALL